MEDRLAEFRTRKEDEVATQLERQLDKREEIMRNKALIEVRKREANIRAEIESQLGVKRAEIRDRLSTLTQQMDDFRSMAEVKMRDSIEGKVQTEIDADANRLAEQQSEFDTLKSQDNRAEKRESWLQAISGQGTQAQQPQMGMDPSALGAKPSTLDATAGRQMRGAMAQAAAQHTPSVGLSGMRAPRSTAKSLSGTQPMAKPIKAPIGGMNLPTQAAILPMPIQPKVIRQPIVQQPETAPPVVESPEILAPSIEPIAETIVQVPDLEIQGISVEEIPEVDVISPIVDTIAPEVEVEVVTIDEILEEALDEAMEDELNEVQATVMLTPIKRLEVTQQIKTAILKPVTVSVLNPVKKRGTPPSSAPGAKPGQKPEKEVVAVLKPVQKLNPVSPPDTTLSISSSDEDE
jgi:hypothetical protein